jgi:hypothetical protein
MKAYTGHSLPLPTHQDVFVCLWTIPDCGLYPLLFCSGPHVYNQANVRGLFPHLPFTSYLVYWVLD